MLRRRFLRALMATPLAGWLGPRILPSFAGAAGEGPNAADVYRGAFGWSEGLRAEDWERLRKAETLAVADPAVDALVDRAGPALDALRRAAAIDECRWGPEVVAVADLGKGHLNAANLNVIRAACVSARRHAGAGRGLEALDDLFAGLALAHRIGTGGFLFARILESSGEATAFRTLGRILPGLDRPALDDLSRRLDALPPPEPASAAIGPESRFILGALRTKLMAIGPVLDDAAWAGLGFDDEEAGALSRLTGGDRARFLAHLDATVPAFAELARRMDRPRPGCRAALEAFAEAERAAHPIAAGLVENAWGVRHAVDRMRALRAMLRAGVALVRDGEAAFRAEPDPFGAGAFGLERRGKAVVIRSALADERRPEVILEIGAPA